MLPVEAKVEIKTKEQLRRIQELLFEQGFLWASGAKSILYVDDSVSDDFTRFLYWGGENHNYITRAEKKDRDSFVSRKLPEYTIESLLDITINNYEIF